MPQVFVPWNGLAAPIVFHWSVRSEIEVQMYAVVLFGISSLNLREVPVNGSNLNSPQQRQFHGVQGYTTIFSFCHNGLEKPLFPDKKWSRFWSYFSITYTLDHRALNLPRESHMMFNLNLRWMHIFHCRERIVKTLHETCLEFIIRTFWPPFCYIHQEVLIPASIIMWSWIWHITFYACRDHCKIVSAGIRINSIRNLLLRRTIQPSSIAALSDFS